MPPHATPHFAYAPFTGFGDDPHSAVKFRVQRDRGLLTDWDGGHPRLARLSIGNSNREVTQNRGRNPWTWSVRLSFATRAELERLHALAGTRATLRYTVGLTLALDGTVETILGWPYLVLPDTELTSVQPLPHPGTRSGPFEAIAVFRRPYVAPVVVDPGPWPVAPHPIIPPPAVYLSPLGSYVHGELVTPTLGGAARVVSLAAPAWQVARAATNINPNPSAATNTTGWSGGSNMTLAAITDDGDAWFEAERTSTSACAMTRTAAITDASPGDEFTFSAVVRVSSGSTFGATTRLRVRWFSGNDGATGQLSDDILNIGSSLTTAPQRFTLAAVAPASAQSATIAIADPTGSGTIGDTFYAREITIQPGNEFFEAIPQFDAGGALLSGYSWSSTAHGSSSSRAAGSISVPDVPDALNAQSGEVLVRVRPIVTSPNNQWLWNVGTNGAPGEHYSGGRFDVTTKNVALRSRSGDGTEQNLILSVSAPTWGNDYALRFWWDGATYGIAGDLGSTSGARTYDGLSFGAAFRLGGSVTPAFEANSGIYDWIAWGRKLTADELAALQALITAGQLTPAALGLGGG